MATSLRPFNSIGGFSVGDNQTTVIDSNGNLVTPVISVSGNVAANLVTSNSDVTALGNISGNFILGNGAFLTGLPAGYSNADVASYLASNAAVTILTTSDATFGGNVISWGSMGSLGGLGTGGDLNVIGNSYFGGEAQITGNTAIVANLTVTAAISAMDIAAGGNLTVAGLANVNGNVEASYFIGDGSLLTGLPAGYSDANVQTYLGAYNSLDIAISGNVSVANGGYFSGDAWALSNIAGANITGEVANAAYATIADTASHAGSATQANVAFVAYSVDAANVSGQVASAAFASEATQSDYANIALVAYSVDAANVSGLSAYVSNVAVANATFADTSGTALVAYSVDAANVVGSVANASFADTAATALVAYSVDAGNVIGSVANAAYADTAATALVAYSVDAANVVGSVANAVYADNAASAAVALTVAGANVTGSVGNAVYADTAGVAQTADAVAASNVTNLSTWVTSWLAATNVADISVDGFVSATGDIVSGGTVSAAFLMGDGSAITDLTGANVVGTVSSANVAYSVDAANIVGSVANATHANTANIAYSVEAANVANLTVAIDNELGVYTGNISGGNIAVTGAIHGHSLNITGDGLVIGNLQVNGNLTYTDITEAYSENPTFTLGTGANGAPLTSDDGLDRAIVFDYFNGADAHSALIWEHASNTFQLASDVTFSNGVATINTLGDIHVGTIYGNIEGNITTDSLEVTNDLTAGDDIWLGGDLRWFGTTAKIRLSQDTGDIIIRGDDNFSNPGIVSASGYFNSPDGTQCLSLDDGSGNVFFYNGIYVSGRSFADNLEALNTITGTNINANANISAVGSVTAADFIGGAFNGANVSVTGNIGGGNVSVTGAVTAATLVATSSATVDSLIANTTIWMDSTGTDDVGLHAAYVNTTATSSTTLLSFTAGQVHEVLIKAKDTITGDFFVATVVVSGDGDFTVFGTVGTSLGAFSTAIGGGTCTLSVTPVSSNSTDWTMAVTHI